MIHLNEGGHQIHGQDRSRLSLWFFQIFFSFFFPFFFPSDSDRLNLAAPRSTLPTTVSLAQSKWRQSWTLFAGVKDRLPEDILKEWIILFTGTWSVKHTTNHIKPCFALIHSCHIPIQVDVKDAVYANVSLDGVTPRYSDIRLTSNDDRQTSRPSKAVPPPNQWLQRSCSIG